MKECITNLIKSDFLEKFFKKLSKENITKISLFTKDINNFSEFLSILFYLENKEIKIGVLTKLPYRFLGFPNVYQLEIGKEYKQDFEFIFFDDSVDSDLVDFRFAKFYFYFGNKNLGMKQIHITDTVIKVIDEYFTIVEVLPIVSRSLLNANKEFLLRVYDVLGEFATYDLTEKKFDWVYGGKSLLIKFLLGKQTKLAGNVTKKLDQALAAIENGFLNPSIPLLP